MLNDGVINACLPAYHFLWTLKQHNRLWKAVDVLDDDEAVSCNNSLQKNKISYKSQRKAVWGRHPIPPSFQQLSARHGGMKKGGLRGQESKGDWDTERRDGVWREGGAKEMQTRSGKQGDMNAWSRASVRYREEERKVVRIQRIFLSSSSSLLLSPSGNVVVIYWGLSSPHGMGGKWALNWVSIHHPLTLMLLVLKCLHLMFLFKINYLQCIQRVWQFITANCSASPLPSIMPAPSYSLSTDRKSVV